MNKAHKMDLLVALYIFLLCAAELMGGKTFPIISSGAIKLNASVAIFLIPFIFSINDVITEVYGPERARNVIRSGLLVISLIIGFGMLATSLPPSMRFQLTESAYDTIFQQSIRISLASLIAFALSDFLDVYLFSKIRKALGKQNLWLRNNVSNIVSQLIDTVVFMMLAFYALNNPLGQNVAFLSSLILPYWLLKCFMSVIETPFVYLGVSWLKRDSS
ncbi:hypothetical protein A3D80_02430 [Candidatus Roizmanbacteria bacterium RIFCSPHIGHO2_02_FULL_40_13b]|uniref:Probable queuosine precursor transporter n=1 Tax=Candidatus Roizmanbacteria bacterium RIFCSPHIGHO2_01_FULL_39_24 TaxID=1802032 RepID=A0A1F7GIA7_9BACT|nr:MAG: hypothetical protein A2799_01920 [Candidatus Roizmanbacteria bacterium RIFCSPHIGHO2_01_FULL_39_24]OGK26497.1 MAG: hypothetical protein A3D80_02430 [Candidatus Roizmanbacteria bacterium RIFCSPHIGHO2_02_FULL_40_13b]OGK50347.1 MAG: hypothetical protein A3A56_00195 [Candidatus Roizmanbacteria bacterium RIFCSPLOWO2_01_FULL_40_32]OGK56192.1 MAG: hypothetical protein A3H83_01585 [Candidatus Roizmanbacteria bacterium RIFCSPLOWO2_02_FULL_39_8]